LLFGSVMLMAHLFLMLSHAMAFDHACGNSVVALTTRLLQGLGCGVLFQAPTIISSVCTCDHHTNLQAKNFLVRDLSLALGATLPLLTKDSLMTSVVLAILSALFILWVTLAFPVSIPCLSSRVRFRLGTKPAQDGANEMICGILFAGTMRVFVQTAMLASVVLAMREAALHGDEQTLVISALCFLATPFQALMTCIQNQGRWPFAKITLWWKPASGALLATAVLLTWLQEHAVADIFRLQLRLATLGALAAALGAAAPFQATLVSHVTDAERHTVILEWLKAYVGRLLGPLVAVLLYDSLGFSSILVMLCSGAWIAVWLPCTSPA
jgi:hypothetical protein